MEKVAAILCSMSTLQAYSVEQKQLQNKIPCPFLGQINTFY